MAQAIAHVVIHEWIHVATQSPAHGAHGITKQFLSPAELTAEPKNNTVATATHCHQGELDNLGFARASSRASLCRLK